MNRSPINAGSIVLQFAPAVVFCVLLVAICTYQPQFRDPANLMDILEQSVPVAIVGIGMTFVLLTAGIDLAVGATMYLSVVIAGLFLKDVPVAVACVASVTTGVLVGWIHALIVNAFRVAPFIVTLASMFILRGVGKRLTETKAIIAPDTVTQLERAALFGIPLAIWVLVALVSCAWMFLRHTGTGRQVYAIGENPEAATKAGINVARVTFIVYMICGACAGLAGFLAFSQQGAAQNTFGTGVEFAAVAAAVLGGTSLFGGRGNVWGAVFGAVFVSVVSSSLNFANADPYIYPLATASLIFLATAIDSLRTRFLELRSRRRIRHL